MVQNHSRPCFLDSPGSGDDFEYLYYGKKIQMDDFKRTFSKKYVKKRLWRVFGPFKGGIFWDVSMKKSGFHDTSFNGQTAIYI